MRRSKGPIPERDYADQAYWDYWRVKKTYREMEKVTTEELIAISARPGSERQVARETLRRVIKDYRWPEDRADWKERMDRLTDVGKLRVGLEMQEMVRRDEAPPMVKSELGKLEAQAEMGRQQALEALRLTGEHIQRGDRIMDVIEQAIVKVQEVAGLGGEGESNLVALDKAATIISRLSDSYAKVAAAQRRAAGQDQPVGNINLTKVDVGKGDDVKGRDEIVVNSEIQRLSGIAELPARSVIIEAARNNHDNETDNSDRNAEDIEDAEYSED